MFAKGPLMLKLVRKYGDVKPQDLTIELVTDVGKLFDRDINTKIASDVIDLIAKDDEETLLDWFSDEDNIGRLKEMMGPAERQKQIFECPKCQELSYVDEREIGAVNPHVVCRLCASVIPI
jgi:hypothetical protein